ncbi:MAG: UDP-N-acetylmuramate dehydrogenase [Patescibacteria group bacterium]|nr:UDP-N-acetylmuramate dehydrogenase [Patescibacteria group bacterium]
MFKVERNKDITNFTTIKVPVRAQYFAVLKEKADVYSAISFAQQKNLTIYILGGGSNLVFTKKIKGLVVKNEIKGIDILKKTKTKVVIRANSGENWSHFVSYTINHGFYGLENLFLIYGTVGAAPVQNIGAYGVELKDVFLSLTAIDLQTGKEKEFSSKACHFAYRDSVFKNKYKGRYFITDVTVQLDLKPHYKLDYGPIKMKLEEQGICKPTLKQMIAIISEIRNSKLPNPHLIPNAGSFFKNPEVTPGVYKKLQKKYPDLPAFKLNKKVKIPAGWLIEKAGFKGKKFGPVAMYEKQALILTNQGGSARQVLALVKRVKKKVKLLFGLDLEEEVNII